MKMEFIILGMVVFAAIGYKWGVGGGELEPLFAFSCIGGAIGAYIGWRYDRWLRS